MVNKGQVVLDIEKNPRPPKKPQPEKPPLKSDDKEENEYTRQLDAVQQAMIKKKKEIAEQERKLGEQILKEQEDVHDSS